MSYYYYTNSYTETAEFQEEKRLCDFFAMLALEPSKKFTIKQYMNNAESKGSTGAVRLGIGLQSQLLGLFWDKVFRLKDTARMRALVACACLASTYSPPYMPMNVTHIIQKITEVSSQVPRNSKRSYVKRSVIDIEHHRLNFIQRTV